MKYKKLLFLACIAATDASCGKSSLTSSSAISNASHMQDMELEIQQAQRAIAPYHVIDITKSQPSISLAIPTEYKILVDNCMQLALEKSLNPSLLQAILQYANFAENNTPHPHFKNLIVVVEQTLSQINQVSKNITKPVNRKQLLKRLMIAAKDASVTIAKEVDITIQGKEQFKGMKGHYNRTTHYAYLTKDGKKINFTNIQEYNRTFSPWSKPFVQFATIPTPGYKAMEHEKKAGRFLATTTLYGVPSMSTGNSGGSF